MSEQVKQCMDLEHWLHWLHLEPTHLGRSSSVSTVGVQYSEYSRSTVPGPIQHSLLAGVGCNGRRTCIVGVQYSRSAV
jgi:hypothetical protein